MQSLLDEGAVVCNRFIIGELALGSLKNRQHILSLLQQLPAADEAEHDEVMRLIDDHNLWGQGLGYIDVHLLASALVSGAQLWTLDGKLSQAYAGLVESSK